jgi:hypothetical protein
MEGKYSEIKYPKIVREIFPDAVDVAVECVMVHGEGGGRGEGNHV